MIQLLPHSPSPDLASVVRCFWTLRGSQQEARRFRFVPDCSPEWVFNLRSVVKCQYKQDADPHTHVAHSIGQFPAYLDMILPGEEFEFFAIKFHPWSAYLLWEGSMRSYTGEFVDLYEDGPEGARQLVEEVMESPDLAGRIRAAEAFLRRRLRGQVAPVLPACFQDLRKVTRDLRIESLEASSNLSRRRLEQLFSEKIGLSPKRIHRIQRIRQAVEFMRHHPEYSLSRIAHHFHFFDQSHFNHELRTFTGFSPRQCRQQFNPDPDILNFVAS